VEVVAHRTPPTRERCEQLAAAGATIFEVDARLAPHGIVTSHFLPALGVPGWLEYDNWTVRWHRRARRDPGLVDTLAVVPAGCRVLLDPKESAPVRRAELARRLAHLVDERFVVSTDDPVDLARYRDAGFVTWRTVKNRRDLAACLGAGALADAAVTVRRTLLDPASVAALHAIAPTVIAWTVNDAVEAATLLRAGVDGLTTDDAGVMRLAARWESRTPADRSPRPELRPGRRSRRRRPTGRSSS
jgi:hypothetical protein